jgi:hypothetical protein
MQQNVNLPPFGSIAPSTSHFNPQQPAHYTQPPGIGTSDTSTAATMHFSNGNGHFEPTVVVKEEYIEPIVDIKEEYIEPIVEALPPQILKAPEIPENFLQVKPKVEIQNIEILSSMKIESDDNSTNGISTNNNQPKKISFSAIPDIIKAQNGHSVKKKLNPVQIQDDELVDFEDAIGSVSLPSVIPIVIPKFEFQKSIQRISNDLQCEALQVVSNNSEQNHRPISAKVSVIKALPKSSPEAVQRLDALQKSPPPLHLFTKDNNCENKIKNEVRTPTKAEQKFLPNHVYDSSVIVKNGIKQEEEVAETIDLTDDICENIDLTDDYNTIHRERRIGQNPKLDFAFVACAEDPIQIHIEPDYLDCSKPRKKYRGVKRQISPNGHETKDCKIRLVDVMENVKQECMLKKNTAVRLVPVRISSPDKVKK